MKEKIGRNSPCPCGSGKKYKRCCGMMEEFSEGIIIEDLETNMKFAMGGPGFTIAFPVMHNGDIDDLRKNINNYRFILNVDLPFLLPIVDDNYSINVLDEDYLVFHVTKRRGQEQFSTLDSKALPFFSMLQIHGDAFNESLPDIPAKDDPPFPKSYEIVIAIVKKIISFFDNDDYNDFITKDPVLSYKIYYLEKGQTDAIPKVISLYPYVGVLQIKGPISQNATEHDKLKKYLSERIKIEDYTIKNIKQEIIDKEFHEKVFISLHDFAFYCRQHPKALYEMHEEQIRDLYLVILKTLFTYADGEVFAYDGKLDFKITNPENKYEIISGEFKWWSGDASFKEAFHQIARKHSTGQEKQLYIIMLSRNKDIGKVKEKIKEIIFEEAEVKKDIEAINLVPKGSRECFEEYQVNIRDQVLPLRIGIVDLYYINV